mmetsp:Transcript_42512/g.62536  ORF Transcript_42512/g.62536 Transcript_42512/m.62536 type:complete len:138 (+) Transcript_42512:578-991(+)
MGSVRAMPHVSAPLCIGVSHAACYALLYLGYHVQDVGYVRFVMMSRATASGTRQIHPQMRSIQILPSVCATEAFGDMIVRLSAMEELLMSAQDMVHVRLMAIALALSVGWDSRVILLAQVQAYNQQYLAVDMAHASV